MRERLLGKLQELRNANHITGEELEEFSDCVRKKHHDKPAHPGDGNPGGETQSGSAPPGDPGPG